MILSYNKTNKKKAQYVVKKENASLDLLTVLESLSEE